MKDGLFVGPALFASEQINCSNAAKLASTPQEFAVSNKSRINLSIAAALMAFTGSSFAASTSTTIAVSAKVSTACSIATTPMVFGDYDPIVVNAAADKTATATVSVSCAKGTPNLSIGMNYGSHVSGTSQPQMVGTTVTGLLSYNVFQPSSTAPGAPCPGTIPWTMVTPGLMVLSAAPSKATRIYNVCGKIPAGQDTAVGVYTDTITATVNF